MAKVTACVNHEKEYGNVILLSHPPQHPWTCKKCGMKGVDKEHETMESGGRERLIY